MAGKGGAYAFSALPGRNRVGDLLYCVPPVPLKGLGRACKQRGEGGSEGVSGVTGVPNWMGYRPPAFLHRKAVRSRSCPRSPRSQRPGPFPNYRPQSV
jgi:hypothetical protein